MRPLSALFLLAATGIAAADDRPVRWEYAELSYRAAPPRPQGKDANGNEVPVSPGVVTIRWTTGAEDVTLKGWDELADKLQVAVKKDATAASQRIRVLNALGAAGWELVDQQVVSPTLAVPTGGPGGAGRGVNTATLLFKRRVP